MSRVRYDWSKLCTDLLRSILETLNTKDFHRARTVCSSWYSVSTTCMRPLHPWRILFRKSSTLLLDPEQQDETLETEHPGTDFSESCVIASCSNWLLMIDVRVDSYLLNVFTCERINLPSMKSLLVGNASFYSNASSSNIPACLWVDERTGDYAVAWSYKEHYLFSYKKGDETWREHRGTRCRSMAYKKNRLYVLTSDDYIKILDLSGDSPKEEGNPYVNHRFRFVSQPGEFVWRKKVAITNSGEVLIVLSLRGLQEKRLFCIFKMNGESGNWERVDTLGGEMLMFGYGVTVRSPIKEIDGEGIRSDSICFVDYDLWPAAEYFRPNRKIVCGVFDLASSTITWPKTSDASVLKSFWFVPGYA
ncbi:putative F-box protein [Raphanus sativus]|uniref:F-box protein At2g33200 n=1 Tax=Raphanus sativus TaxID=3726 RepID=A0A6J0MTV9_RAPSA|nr:putative F-box protein At2g33200 [Raphanus sativus]XP_056860781.1 putative F-box protein At2g33200 [Raphanus sativus]KAJ4907186.1 putative F-box protein [Raphanus sativus]KAJ4907188.1 putative F-box protein [Raphanus sativus]